MSKHADDAAYYVKISYLHSTHKNCIVGSGNGIGAGIGAGIGSNGGNGNGIGGIGGVSESMSLPSDHDPNNIHNQPTNTTNPNTTNNSNIHTHGQPRNVYAAPPIVGADRESFIACAIVTNTITNNSGTGMNTARAPLPYHMSSGTGTGTDASGSEGLSANFSKFVRSSLNLFRNEQFRDGIFYNTADPWIRTRNPLNIDDDWVFDSNMGTVSGIGVDAGSASGTGFTSKYCKNLLKNRKNKLKQTNEAENVDISYIYPILPSSDTAYTPSEKDGSNAAAVNSASAWHHLATTATLLTILVHSFGSSTSTSSGSSSTNSSSTNSSSTNGANSNTKTNANNDASNITSNSTSDMSEIDKSSSILREVKQYISTISTTTDSVEALAINNFRRKSELRSLFKWIVWLSHPGCIRYTVYKENPTVSSVSFTTFVDTSIGYVDIPIREVVLSILREQIIQQQEVYYINLGVREIEIEEERLLERQKYSYSSGILEYFTPSKKKTVNNMHTDSSSARSSTARSSSTGSSSTGSSSSSSSDTHSNVKNTIENDDFSDNPTDLSTPTDSSLTDSSLTAPTANATALVTETQQWYDIMGISDDFDHIVPKLRIRMSLDLDMESEAGSQTQAQTQSQVEGKSDSQAGQTGQNGVLNGVGGDGDTSNILSPTSTSTSTSTCIPLPMSLSHTSVSVGNPTKMDIAR